MIELLIAVAILGSRPKKRKQSPWKYKAPGRGKNKWGHPKRKKWWRS